jgi:hypothetical protein
MITLLEIFDEVKADSVGYLKSMINNVINKREEFTKEKIKHYIRSHFSDEVPKDFIDFTYRFAKDIIKFAKSNSSNLQHNTLKVINNYDISLINNKENFKSCGYDGEFKWDKIISYYYNIYKKAIIREDIEKESYDLSDTSIKTKWKKFKSNVSKDVDDGWRDVIPAVSDHASSDARG